MPDDNFYSNLANFGFAMAAAGSQPGATLAGSFGQGGMAMNQMANQRALSQAQANQANAQAQENQARAAQAAAETLQVAPKAQAGIALQGAQADQAKADAAARQIESTAQAASNNANANKANQEAAQVPANAEASRNVSAAQTENYLAEVAKTRALTQGELMKLAAIRKILYGDQPVNGNTVTPGTTAVPGATAAPGTAATPQVQGGTPTAPIPVKIPATPVTGASNFDLTSPNTLREPFFGANAAAQTPQNPSKVSTATQQNAIVSNWVMPGSGTGVLNTELGPIQDRKNFLMSEYNKGQVADGVARETLTGYNLMDQAASRLADSKLLGPGAGVDARLEAANSVNNLMRMVNLKPAFDTSNLADASAFKKQATIATMELTNHYFGGQREAASIISMLKGATPDLTAAYPVIHNLLAQREEEAAKPIALHSFRTNWMQNHNGDLEGADTVFNANYTPEKVAARAASRGLGQGQPATSLQDAATKYLPGTVVKIPGPNGGKPQFVELHSGN